jgi:hypothetical protein
MGDVDAQGLAVVAGAMGNGQWAMGNGQWAMGNGQCKQALPSEIQIITSSPRVTSGCSQDARGYPGASPALPEPRQ